MIINTPVGHTGPRIDGYEIRGGGARRRHPVPHDGAGGGGGGAGDRGGDPRRGRGDPAAGAARAAGQGRAAVAGGASEPVAARRGPASGSGSPSPCGSTGRSAWGSTRTRACWRRWGHEDDAAGVERFGRDAVVGRSPGTWPWSSRRWRCSRCTAAGGCAALERVLADARDAGLLTIADAKRGDIGSTMTAYAKAWLADSSPLAADAVTLSPYLGVGVARPGARPRRRHRPRRVRPRPHVEPGGAGGAVGADVDERAGDAGGGAGAWSTPAPRSTPRRAPRVAGVVVGATAGTTGREHGLDLTRLGGPVLVPGLGAQGATPDDLAGAFGAGLVGGGPVVPSSSREVLAVGPDPGALRATAARAERHAARPRSRDRAGRRVRAADDLRPRSSGEPGRVHTPDTRALWTPTADGTFACDDVRRPDGADVSRAAPLHHPIS